MELNDKVNKRAKGLKNPINYLFYSKWFISDYSNDSEGILALDESIVMCNLPMMIGNRYDKKITNEYESSISGYKNWKDFCKRTMRFFTGTEIILDEKCILLNMITRLFNKLKVLSTDKCEYIILFSTLSLGIRLYYMKNFNKNDLYQSILNSEYYEDELDRLIKILKFQKNWHTVFLNEVIHEDMSFRYYRIKKDLNLKDDIICIR